MKRKKRFVANRLMEKIMCGLVCNKCRPLVFGSLQEERKLQNVFRHVNVALTELDCVLTPLRRQTGVSEQMTKGWLKKSLCEPSGVPGVRTSNNHQLHLHAHYWNPIAFKEYVRKMEGQVWYIFQTATVVVYFAVCFLSTTESVKWLKADSGSGNGGDKRGLVPEGIALKSTLDPHCRPHLPRVMIADTITASSRK